MIDPKLETLSKYSECDFITKNLKRKFLNIFYDHYEYPIHERDNISFDYFEIGQPECYDLDGNLILKAHFRKFDYYDFLKSEIKKEFDNLNTDFYNEVKFISNRKKIHNYLSLLLSQLEEILVLIRNNKSIPNKLRNIITNSFLKWIDSFAKFHIRGLKIIKRKRSIPNSFTYKKLNPDFKSNLNDLLSSLKRSGLVHPESKKVHFYKIFNNVKVKDRVRWEGSISEFYYFIKQISNHSEILDLKNLKWEVASNCFYLPSNKNVGEFNWRKLRSQKPPNKLKMLKIENYMRF